MGQTSDKGKQRAAGDKAGSQPTGRGGSAEAKGAEGLPLDRDPVPNTLVRTAVYRNVPATVRARLDKAILRRPESSATLEAIGQRFKLDRYGVSISALRSYAGRLESLVRPAVASQVLAGVLGCLPGDYRERIVAGSRVLLLSRVVQALAGEGGQELSVADLAKLASILKAVAGSRSDGGKATGRRSRRSAGDASGTDSSPSGSEPAKLAETLRTVYGLTWPTNGQADHTKE